MKNLFAISCIALALAGAGCRENPIVVPANGVPVAYAWVSGEPLPPEDASTKPTVMVPYEGSPVEVTLDGTHSTDDGTIVTYRWLSATQADGGGRLIPGFEDDDAGPSADDSNADEGRGYPADEAKPTVTLTQGFWTFALWVIDDKGVVSDQDTITIQVGDTGPAPEVQECIDGVLDVVNDNCQLCICSSSDACRAAVVACDEVCWGLIDCIATNCPDFAAMAGAGDFSCYLDNCQDFGAGSTAAMAAGDCVTPCAAECAAAP